MEKEKSNNKLMLFVAVFLLFISLIAFIISWNIDSITSFQKKEIPISVIISNNTAINVSNNQTDLNLGTVKTGTAGMRNLSISNDYPFKSVFEFEVTGDIAPLMIFQPVVILEPNENKNLVFKTKVITNESFGQYSGTLLIKIRKFIE